MKAVVIERFGGPEVLEIKDLPKPVPGEREILVRVMGAGLNRADILQRRGKYPAPAGPANILGMEFAGEVAACGPGAGRWRPGQRVFGLIPAGAQAEFVVTHERAVAEIPASLGWAEAATIPEAFMTAYDAMWRQAALAPGESVLIHAVASGVGLAAVELARARTAIAYGTSRSAAKLEAAKKRGMTKGIAVTSDPAVIAEKIHQWTNGRGVDVVIDLVGGNYVLPSIESLAPRGRMIFVGTVAGNRAEFNLGTVMSKRLHLIGTVLRSRSLEEKIALTEDFARDVVPLLASKIIAPVIDHAFPLDEVQAAHQRMEADENVGKIILLIAAR